MDGVADIERGDIKADDLGQILGQTLDFDGVHVDFEETAGVLDARSFAKGLDRNLGVQFLVGAHRMKIDVQHIAPDGVALHFLDQRKAVGRGAAVLDLEIDEDVLAGRTGE